MVSGLNGYIPVRLNAEIRCVGIDIQCKPLTQYHIHHSLAILSIRFLQRPKNRQHPGYGGNDVLEATEE